MRSTTWSAAGERGRGRTTSVSSVGPGPGDVEPGARSRRRPPDRSPASARRRFELHQQHAAGARADLVGQRVFRPVGTAPGRPGCRACRPTRRAELGLGVVDPGPAAAWRRARRGPAALPGSSAGPRHRLPEHERHRAAAGRQTPPPTRPRTGCRRRRPARRPAAVDQTVDGSQRVVDHRGDSRGRPDRRRCGRRPGGGTAGRRTPAAASRRASSTSRR